MANSILQNEFDCVPEEFTANGQKLPVDKR